MILSITTLSLILVCGIAVFTPFILVIYSSSYFFNFHALGSLFTSYFVGALGLTIASKKLDKEERYYFFLLTLSVFFWLWTAGMANLCRMDQWLLSAKWFKAGNLGVVFIAVHIYAFTIKYLKLNRRKMLVVGQVIASMFALLTIFTNYFVTGVHYYPWGYSPQWNFLHTVPYFVYFFVYLTSSLFEYLHAYRKSENLRYRNQIRYLFIAFAISYFGAIDYLPVFGYSIYPCGYIAVFGWWTILAYSILKYRLMDITVIIRKTLIYTAVMTVLTAIYLIVVALFAHLFEGLTGYQTVFSSTAAALLITSCFQPLRKRVQAFVDSKFFRQYVDREEKLYELSREVITHTTPEAMAQSLIRVLGDTLHPKSAALYLRSRDGDGFVQVSQKGASDIPLRMPESNPLTKYFLDHPQPFVQDLPAETAQPRDTRRPDRTEDAA